MDERAPGAYSTPFRGFLFIFFVALALAGGAGSANAALFGGVTGLDPAFCKQRTFRQTVVYIDDTMMHKGQKAWAIALNSRLDASLTPGERVTVVQISPRSGTSRQIWTGCWPNYTAAQRKNIEAKTYIITSNPLRDLKMQRKYFTHDLDIALGKIYGAGIRHARDAAISASSPPSREIIAALASDSARFSESDTTIRAIVYSDLAQNSKTASVFSSDQDQTVNYGQRLGTYFHDTVFYFYGVGTDVSGVPDFIEKSKAFWSHVLGTMNATIEAFGSDLVVSNRVPVEDYRYSLSLDRNGQKLFGRMSLLADEDGHLIDSWIGISRLAFVAIRGTFQCAGKGSGCRLRATTNGSLTTNSPQETIDLSGRGSSSLSGTVGVAGALTFNMTANARSN